MRLVLTSLLMLAAGSVQAAECSFDLECFEDETCAATEMSFEVTQNAEKPAQMQMVTDSETLQGVGFRRSGPRHMVFFGDTAAHMLTLYENKSARYTAHMAGVLAITYHGSCGDIE